VRVTDFLLRVDGNNVGYLTEPEVVEWLEGYRVEHPEDGGFRRVRIHEFSEHGTVGHERSPWDFVTRPGTG
jgi:hypothetical protein